MKPTLQPWKEGQALLKVISLFPNQPRSNDKGIHEEIVMKLTLASYIIE
jgi:hypothetical protein